MTNPAWFTGNPAANLEIAASLAAAEDAGVSYTANGNSGAAITVNFANGPVQQVVLSASAPTITLTGFTTGASQRLRLLLKQDATGSRLIPVFSPVLNWGTPGAPTLTTTAAKTDMIDITTIDGGATFLAVTVAKGF